MSALDEIDIQHETAMRIQDAVVDIVADQIELSQALMKASGVNVMSSESDRNIWDDWVIGYIAGACDGAMQSYSISESDPVVPLIVQGAFRRLFNNPNLNHEILFKRAFEQLNSPSNAVELGAKDTMRWLKFSYENKEEEPAKDVMFKNFPNLLQAYLTTGLNNTAEVAKLRGFELITKPTIANSVAPAPVDVDRTGGNFTIIYLILAAVFGVILYSYFAVSS